MANITKASIDSEYHQSISIRDSLINDHCPNSAIIVLILMNLLE